MSNQNLLSILQIIRQNGPLTRRALADRLGLGFSMTSKLVTELLEGGLLCEMARTECALGRPSDLLALNPAAAYAIGLDIETHRQRAVLINLIGEVVYSAEQSVSLPASREGILEVLGALINGVCCPPEGQARLYGLGVGLWGSVDPQGGVVYSWTEAPELYEVWKNFGLRAALRERYPFPHIHIDDVVRSMGLAEVLADSGQNERDFIYALADSGVGLALMVDGEPYVGPAQLAGEIGHIPIGGTKPCNCGNIGCLETLCSANAILEQASRRLNEVPIPSALRDIRSPLTIEQVIATAETGDKLAYQLMVEAGEKFGIGLAIAANLFGPRRMVVGGSLAASSVYLDAARRTVRLQALAKVSGELRIKASQLDRFAGARGAASQVLNALFSEGDANLLNLTTVPNP